MGLKCDQYYNDLSIRQGHVECRLIFKYILLLELDISWFKLNNAFSW